RGPAVPPGLVLRLPPDPLQLRPAPDTQSATPGGAYSARVKVSRIQFVQKEALPPGIVRAALAFSALSNFQADSISGRLRPRDRARLRAGLVHVRGASLNERRDALQKLVAATRHGPEWRTPAAHDPADCPFRCVETHTAVDVARTFEKIVARRPLHIAV